MIKLAGVRHRMGAGKETSLEKRQLVIYHSAKGKTQQTVADLLNMKRSTVRDILLCFKKEQRIEKKKRTGRPRKITPREKNIIIRKIQRNPKLSAPILTAEYYDETKKKVHPETIRRVLRDNGYHNRIARRKPYINERNRKRRLQFAKEYIEKPVSWWQDVIFCDESKFKIFGSDGKERVWRKPNTELEVKNLKATVKHGGGNIMVWGCMGAAGVGELVEIETTMDKKLYLSILQNNLSKSAVKLGVKETFKFYQDNDPKHSSFLVQEWLLYNCPHIIKTPAQSPDLNVIENVWDELDRRVRKMPITSRTELRQRLNEEWSKLGAEYTAKLVASMPTRLQAVIDQRGYATKY